ncbi:MAG: hypothetical protein P4L64_01110 [Caulobacteraceae bacterium]|nr:hypothetical protein [Caulobacteraceae bacterium]
MIIWRNLIRDWGPGLGLMALAFAMAIAVEAAPNSGGAVAAVFPPWWSSAQITAAAAAAGRITAGGGAPFVVSIISSHPGLADRARAQGAWLVVRANPRGLCGAKGLSE